MRLTQHGIESETFHFVEICSYLLKHWDKLLPATTLDCLMDVVEHYQCKHTMYTYRSPQFSECL